MDKFAQKRNIINKLHEWGNVGGRAAESFFNPEFKKVMDDLRLKDDNIRSIIAGETIGDGQPGNDPIALKDLLKSCKSNLNRREYMSAISDLGRFHAKLFEVEKYIQQLDATVNEVHHEFLFKDLDEEKRKHLHDLKTRFAANQNKIAKTAGIMDFFHNLTTNRGRALAAWEKRYPKKTARLKKETFNILNKSEQLLGVVLSTLKEMASARANRNVDEYMKSASKLSKVNLGYDKLFKVYYDNDVKEFMQFIQVDEPVVKKTEEKPNDQPSISVDSNLPGHEPTPPSSYEKSNVPTTKVTSKPPSSGEPSKPPSNGLNDRSSEISPKAESIVNPLSHTMPSPAIIPLPPKVPSEMAIQNDQSETFSESASTKKKSPTMIGVAPPPPMAMDKSLLSGKPANKNIIPNPANDNVVLKPENDTTLTEDKATVGGGKKMTPSEMKAFEEQHGITEAHKCFYETLEAFGNESPSMLRLFISRYANKIANTDPTISIKLLKIAKNIKG